MMVINSFHFGMAFLSCLSFFITGIRGGFLIPDPSSADNPIDIRPLLNRLDQLESRVHDQQNEIDEIDQREKKNEELEHNLESILNNTITKLNLVSLIVTGISCLGPASRSKHRIPKLNPDSISSILCQINGDDPIQAYCDMTTRTTNILHDTEGKTSIDSCADAGCYTKEIKYNATLRQMQMLADLSGSCQQCFKFDSLSVPLELNGIQYGYWNDRNSAKQVFWAGNANTNHTCQCGLENPNRCIDPQYKCNAGSLAPIELSDEGYITATELLPFTSLSFGRTSPTGVKTSYTLGRFQCSGHPCLTNLKTAEISSKEDIQIAVSIS